MRGVDPRIHHLCKNLCEERWTRGASTRGTAGASSREVLRQFALNLGRVDLAFAPGLRRGPGSSFVASSLSCLAAFWFASRSSTASTSPTHVCLAAIL